MPIGYARVSTQDQNRELQLTALADAGCNQVFVNKASGVCRERPMLAKAPAALKPGDTLTVWKLDRLARSLSHLLALFEDLHARGVGFRGLTEATDTTTPAGRLISQIMDAFAEFERALISERTKAGLAVARANGRTGGAGQRSRQ
jgi:DNA invertase Pin-like site-specific DNA recombinase